jgi:dynactin complex subunit|tara:strand:- start:328 stop:621 length:294 start_codon:yes stop_codon:yes gene_type:complete
MADEAKKVEEVKFTDDELKSLQELQTGYQEKQNILGQLAVQKILLNQQIDALNIRTEEVETEYQTVQQEERDLVKKLNEKYGPGQLDPTTGVFTPST